MENLTTQEEPISLRDTIENAIESTEPEVTETISQEVTESVKAEKPRDEHGKFAKSSQNASDDVTEAFDDNNQQEIAVKRSKLVYSSCLYYSCVF